MPRPRRIRRIFYQPTVTYFKPAGIPLAGLAESMISYDELEAVRLVDLEEMEQEKACKKMKISQPTLSRLLKSGRKKLADAVVSGKAIRVQGGNFEMVQPRMGAGRGMGMGGGRGRMSGPMAAGPGGICKCPKCGYEEPQIRGQPCMNKKCPKCGTQMARA